MSVKIQNFFLAVVILFLTACHSNYECPPCQIGGKDGDSETQLPREEDQEQREDQEQGEIPATPEEPNPVPPPAGDQHPSTTHREIPPTVEEWRGVPPITQRKENPPLPSDEQREQTPGDCPMGVPKDDSKEAPGEEIRKPLSLQWNDLDEFKHKFDQLECQDCPPSFGHLIRKFDLNHDGETFTMTKNCQGSLIDEDLFLTARHCLPSYFNPGDSCEGDVKVILPRIGDDKPMEILDCDQLIRVSKTYEGLSKEDSQPDWAILKLKRKSSGRFLKPDMDNAKGISDNESLFAFSIFENPRTEEISIAQIKCRAIQNSWDLPEFNNNLSPLALLQCDHPLGPGFSGMTLFRKGEDQQYSPVGIHSHSRGEESERRSVISQVICMGEGEKPGFCEFYPDKRGDHRNKIYIKSLENSKVEIDKKLKHLIGDESNPIEWRQVNSENWRNLPKNYVANFNKTIEKFNKIMGEAIIHYIQNRVPVYPKCVRRSFVPDKGAIKIPVQIPMTEVSLTKREDQKVATYYKITYLEANLVLGSDDPKEIKNGFASLEDRKFIIRFISEIPSSKFPENTIIINGTFSHNLAVIPLCPVYQDFQGI